MDFVKKDFTKNEVLNAYSYAVSNLGLHKDPESELTLSDEEVKYCDMVLEWAKRMEKVVSSRKVDYKEYITRQVGQDIVDEINADIETSINHIRNKYQSRINSLPDKSKINNKKVGSPGNTPEKILESIIVTSTNSLIKGKIEKDTEKVNHRVNRDRFLHLAGGKTIHINTKNGFEPFKIPLLEGKGKKVKRVRLHTEVNRFINRNENRLDEAIKEAIMVQESTISKS